MVSWRGGRKIKHIIGLDPRCHHFLPWVGDWEYDRWFGAVLEAIPDKTRGLVLHLGVYLVYV